MSWICCPNTATIVETGIVFPRCRQTTDIGAGGGGGGGRREEEEEEEGEEDPKESWRSSARFEARVCSAWLAPRRPQASSCGVPSCCGGGDHSAAHPELGVSGASSGRTAADDFDPAGERGAPAAPAARAASLACQAASSPRRRTC
ncbi:unnamed protein product [Prorocentrum cordatum]|uniref:Uncharacterized protein n=1 Tax=Prorocentrum cordatum TaxID=2364126 RepID=A0ABN9UUZ9_9DINO|nr:unnamed protein product [Polarella glacialis]